jgi:WD40 repeat protein
MVPNKSRGLVYEIEYDACVSGHCNSLATAKVDSSGAKPLQVSYGPTSPQLNPERLALDPNGHYLFATAEEFGRGWFLLVMQLQPDGPMTAELSSDTQLCSAVDIAATSSGTRTYVYNTCFTGGIELHVVDNTTGTVISSTSFATSGKAEGLAVDPSGQYLLVADTSINTVDVFKIDPATGNLGNAATQTAAGTGPNVLTFDTSGKFVYVANGTCFMLRGVQCADDGSNGIQAFSWSGGTLKPIGSYRTGKNPVALAVWRP